MPRLSILFLLAVVLPLTACSSATDEQQPSMTFEEFRDAAEKGDPDVQLNLGAMYFIGYDVPQDYAEAEKWWRRAAEQGNARAQFYLGRMYHQGQGVPRNDLEAVSWFHLAAEQDDGHAQTHLGDMYRQGQGVPQDHAEAVKRYRQAADQAYPTAQHKLGLMYLNGLGVPQDHVVAYALFYIALVTDSDEAEEDLKALKQRMTHNEITEAKGLVQECIDRNFRNCGF